MSARPLGFEPASVPALVPVPAPRQLGKYLISQLLGEGAMGVVYRAIDPHIDRAVALKAIRAPLLAPGAHGFGAAARFRTEAQAAGRLSHPNIVSVYEYGESGGEHYIAMEYVDGISLLELTARGGRLPLEDALCLMLQLLDALACAHAQGVWHRDIKPANLLITPDGRLKVTDFGIARIDSADRTHHTTVLGSPGYMAPERYTDEAPDQRVDIYSCGVLLYELLTGTSPFRGSSGAVMYQVLNVDPPAPSTLPLQPRAPAQFDAVVARALARRAADRYGDAAQMRAALCAAADRPIRPAISVETLLQLRQRSDAAPTEVLARRPAGVPGAAGAPGVPAAANAPSAPGWDARVLAAVETLLRPQLGAMAGPVVRAAARHCSELCVLLPRIADEALDDDDRRDFLARAQTAWPGLRSAAAAAPAVALPVLGSTPMRPDLLEAAQRVLADQIGPIAALLVRRAAATATTREQFHAALADLAGDEVDRKQLIATLWRSA